MPTFLGHYSAIYGKTFKKQYISSRNILEEYIPASITFKRLPNVVSLTRELQNTYNIDKN